MQAKRVTDTLFFKHKYIAQPEVTPADIIIKAYHNLTSALQGIKNSMDSRQMHVLQQIEEQLKPGNKFQIQQQLQCRLPRVDKARAQELTVKSQLQVPRVQFEEPNADESTPTWIIVASPQEQIVKLPPKPIVKPVPIIKEPKYIVEEDSIAARLKARQSAISKVAATADESIAEWLLCRKWESRTEKAFPVLDPNTGPLLE